MADQQTSTVVVPASPEAVYAVLLDPAAIARWRVPDGMTAEVHVHEPWVGGAVRVSLTYDGDEAGKSGGHTDTYAGHFAELVPGRRIVEVIAFETDDPGLRGEMTMTTTLEPVAGGTLVGIGYVDLPPGVDPADNDAGSRMALDNLRLLFDSDDPRAVPDRAP